MKRLRVVIFGAGKVGRALTREIRAASPKWSVVLRPRRLGLPRKPFACDFLVLAVRDGEIEYFASQIAEKRLLGRDAACVHLSGSLGPDALAPLRNVCGGVAQMHPLIAFASTTRSPALANGHMHLSGDRFAVARARALARHLGMAPRALKKVDLAGYHAAAALVSNGGTALAAMAAELFVKSGVPPKLAPQLLGPLLRSVATNITEVGFPNALTGPIRRGDAKAVAKHLAAIESYVPEGAALYAASAAAQLPLARAIGEAPKGSLDAISAMLARPRKRKS